MAFTDAICYQIGVNTYQVFVEVAMRVSSKNKKNGLSSGFSLVELALALGILGFTMTALIGMLPFGLSAFKQAMTNTIESEIVQNLSNDILLANYSDLYKYNSQSYYYDYEGMPLPSSTGAVYTATVSMIGIGGANSPLSLTNNGVSTSSTQVNTSAYNVTITISNVNTPTQSQAYPVIIANNNQ
jgi:uncharacterized protein (TIGR02598 family)